ncbi:RNA-directed DNA polymerase [Sorangium sp. So ce1335]|uniref:RNA-directed DNA polymerase n=1 Tax=Sorangium sp. So ce1335 TaxID=3133335 RepID=UPI003F60100B
MHKLAPTSLDWALEHLRRYSDTDKFPHPFEVDVMARLWASSLRTQLSDIDLTQHRWTRERKMLVPKDAASFRNAAQLDPIDAVLLAGLIYEVGAQIEQKRSPVADKRVFSYRFAPRPDGTLFGPDQWDKFWETSIFRSLTRPVVLMLDITDFYNQISHHSIENQLTRCGLSAQDVKILMNLLKSSTASVSKGIPVGPHPTHLLAEASLIPIDELMTQRGFDFCRYVDDIHVFCDNEETAQVALFAIAGALDQYHKLTPNRSKTQIVPAAKFQKIARAKADDQPINSMEQSVLSVIKKYSTGPYDATPVSRLDAQDLAQLSQKALEDILAAYLASSERDYVRLRFLLRRLAQVGVPGAVEFLVHNLSHLLPAFAEVASYLNAATPHYAGSWAVLGNDLLRLLDSPIAKESEYIQLVILGLFGRIVGLNHIDKLTGRFYSSGPSAQREIILAAANAGADAWLRTLKADFSRYDPWLRRAFAYASRVFPEDECKFWIKEVKPLCSPLELAILKDSSP